MSTMLSTPLSSPTFTATSTASSFDFISTGSRSSSTDSSQSLQFSEDSDDEIVWSVASSDILSPSVLSASESSILSASEDDFVLLETRGSSLSTPHSHAAASLASDLQGLTLSSPATPTTTTKPIKKCKNKPLALTTRPPSVATLTSAPSSPKRKRARKPKDTASTGLGARPIVDDVSEGVSEPLEAVANPPSVYEDAVRYINSFLTNPGSSVCRLTLLQSLIIELGLASSSLPASLSAAKAYLKSRAFVNIRDYLAVRGQGPQAVQATMHPSRSALIKDIRRKKNQASLKWVKQNGLGVLLVQCFH